LASDGLKGRVFAVSLADLNKDEDRAYRIMKFVVEDVQGMISARLFVVLMFRKELPDQLPRHDVYFGQSQGTDQEVAIAH
jgi:ribosomal protein S3AE